MNSSHAVDSNLSTVGIRNGIVGERVGGRHLQGVIAFENAFENGGEGWHKREAWVGKGEKLIKSRRGERGILFHLGQKG